MFVLRKYQEEGVKACIEILTSKRKCKEVVVAPTGAGKSIIIAKAVKEVDFPVIVLQPSKELLIQNYTKFIEVGGEASIYSASVKSFQKKGVPYTNIKGKDVRCDEVSKVTYATIGSIMKEVDTFKELKVKGLVIDECFPSYTPIVTDKGVSRIIDIYKKFNDGDTVHVKSYNENTNKFEYKKVVGVKNNGKKDTIKLKFYKLSLTCTENHKFLTLNGWKEANKLKKGEPVISSYEDDNVGAYGVVNKDQKDLIIGSSLGDSSLDVRNENTHTVRIRMIQGEKQEKYIKWKSRILKSKNKIQRVEKNGYAQTVAYRFNSPVMYVKDSISNYEEQIEKLNYKSLAILWMDDGHMSRLENSGSLYALCDKRDLVLKLKEKLTKLNIRDLKVRKTKSSSTGRSLWYIQFRKQSIEDISKLCAPYIHKSMEYKIMKEYRKNVGTYIWDKEYSNVVKLLRKIDKGKEEVVYDIEVEDNHNFIVTSKNAYKYDNYNIKRDDIKISKEGIVAHNCHLNTQSGSNINRFIEEVGIKNVLGLTATPVYLRGGMEGSVLKMINRTSPKLFSKIRHVTQISELVENKYWSPLIYRVFTEDGTILKPNSSGSDFTKESQDKYFKENELDKRITWIVDKLREQRVRKSILIFVPTIDSAEELSRKIKNSAVVHSKISSKERNQIVEDFKNLKIDVVVNVNVLSVGFDHPQLDTIITSRPTMSMAMYYQQIGRGVRIHPDKESCAIIDLSGNHERFGKIETLNFEDIEGYGWGMFKGDELLTDYPIIASKRPTKQSLGVVRSNTGHVLLSFGKYKGESINKIGKKDLGYLVWMVENFNFTGTKGTILKREIENYLKL